MKELLGRNELWLGVDPDLHSTALALADEKRVVAVKVIRVDKSLRGSDAVVQMCRILGNSFRSLWPILKTPFGLVVEGQHYHTKGSLEKATPEDLINLSAVSGACLAGISSVYYGIQLLRPLPSEWKGSVAKVTQQARTCQRYGWTFKTKGGAKPYVVPESFGEHVPLGADDLNEGDWKHVMDAIGLARWAATRVTAERLADGLDV
jgi:hypothetical protein